jgi:hypothetical protein
MLITLLSLTLLAASPATPAAAADAKMEHHEHGKAPTNAAFDKMKTLVGDWTATTPMGTSTVSYKLASNGTVLVETISGGTDYEMITVYHPEKDGVMLTHYCAAGNQPRMRAKKLADDKLAFDFVDVSGADPKKGGFMRSLAVTFKDPDHYTAVWTNDDGGGKTSPFAFELTRVKPAPATGG